MAPVLSAEYSFSPFNNLKKLSATVKDSFSLLVIEISIIKKVSFAFVFTYSLPICLVTSTLLIR